MMRPEIRELLRAGLIGRNAKVSASQNKDAIGFAGVIVDESRDMLTLEREGDKKRFIKDQHTFLITIDNHTVEVVGKLLAGRPEERIKKWLQSKITKTSASR